jgi:hypothetical protein
MPDGRLRHSAYYSVTDSEWPTIKQRLTASIDAIVAAGATRGAPASSAISA